MDAGEDEAKYNEYYNESLPTVEDFGEDQVGNLTGDESLVSAAGSEACFAFLNALYTHKLQEDLSWSHPTNGANYQLQHEEFSTYINGVLLRVKRELEGENAEAIKCPLGDTELYDVLLETYKGDEINEEPILAISSLIMQFGSI